MSTQVSADQPARQNVLHLEFKGLNDSARYRYRCRLQGHRYTIAESANPKSGYDITAEIEFPSMFRVRRELEDILNALNDYSPVYKRLRTVDIWLNVGTQPGFKEHYERFGAAKWFRRTEYSSIHGWSALSGAVIRLEVREAHHYQEAITRFMPYMEQVVAWLDVYRKVNNLSLSRDSRNSGLLYKINSQIARSTFNRLNLSKG